MGHELQNRIAAMIHRAGAAPVITLTEQKLCKIWRTGSVAGNWWDTFQQLRAVADVLKAEGRHDASDLFTEAAMLASTRFVDCVQHKEWS